MIILVKVICTGDTLFILGKACNFFTIVVWRQLHGVTYLVGTGAPRQNVLKIYYCCLKNIFKIYSLGSAILGVVNSLFIWLNNCADLGN